jgi:hypothetical protein
MLRIPSFKRIGDDLTAYGDDAKWTRFYLVPSIPTIRRDEKGQPIFLLTIFHASDQSRESTPDAPKGGGFLNFDVQFAVDDAARESATRELQKWVNDEYARRRADPQYSSLPEYSAAEPPKVEVTDPLLSGGTVTMHTTQSKLLVTDRFAEAPASLVSGSTAVFNLDLTENGADFMHELFVDKAGSGRIDLTPVQVIYNLQMQARLPPILIDIIGDSERIHSTLLKVSETNRDNPCTPAEVETFRESGTNSSTLVETGMVVVKIDKGDATVPDDVVQPLQQYAMDLFDEMIAERFLVPAETDDTALGFDESDPGLSPIRPGWARFRPTSRYKVRESVNHSTMHLEVKLERSQVVNWPTGGQATLETFFAGASREELKRHVVELTSASFDTLGVTVRALVDFDKQPIQAVEVQTEYTSTDSDGQTKVVPGSFTFRSGEVAPAKFDPTVVGGRREYRHRTRVIYDDGKAGTFTRWETSSSRGLNVTVENAGRLALEVSGASLNWDVVRGVKVALAYDDPADSSAHSEKTFELTKLTPVRTWEQQFDKQIAGGITATLAYSLSDDKVVEGGSHSVALTDTLFIVPPPQVDVLNVSLVPSGNWSDVAQAVVSMKYDAGDGRVYDRAFRFKGLDEIAEWTVLLRDPNRRAFQYQTVVAYKSGGDERSEWITKTGDQAVLIAVKGLPKLRLNVLSNLVDFTRTPVVKVSLTYGAERKTISFTSPGATVVEFPAVAGAPTEYAYEITWIPAAGEPLSSGLQRTADTELFIPRAQMPTVGKLEVIVRGFAVDFAATPFVDVALHWKDGDREERKTLTLSKETPNAVWSVDIGDRTQRKYKYAITYNLADGTRVEGAQGETDDPVISVTRRQS